MPATQHEPPRTVLEALPRAVRAIARNPIIVGILLAYGSIQLPAQFAGRLGPMVSLKVSIVYSLGTFIVFPFVYGGLVKMANEALNGRTSLRTFFAAGRQFYARMFGAYALWLAASAALSAVVFVGILFAAFAGIGPTNGSPPVVLSAIAIGGVVVVGYLVAGFFLQFWAHAIVFDGQGVITGFTWSATLVRRNLVTVLGYTLLLVGIIGTVVVLNVSPEFIIEQRSPRGFASTVPPAPFEITLLTSVSVLVGTSIIGGLTVVLSVAVYQAMDAPTNT